MYNTDSLDEYVYYK